MKNNFNIHYNTTRGENKMHLEKVLEILSKHIIRVEEENQLLNWEIERIRKELEQLKSGLEEKIDKYEKIFK